jgi:hypothetical protein
MWRVLRAWMRNSNCGAPSTCFSCDQCGVAGNVDMVVSLEDCEVRGVVEAVIDIQGRTAHMERSIAVLVTISSTPTPHLL